MLQPFSLWRKMQKSHLSNVIEVGCAKSSMHFLSGSTQICWRFFHVKKGFSCYQNGSTWCYWHSFACRAWISFWEGFSTFGVGASACYSCSNHSICIIQHCSVVGSTSTALWMRICPTTSQRDGRNISKR